MAKITLFLLFLGSVQLSAQVPLELQALPVNFSQITDLAFDGDNADMLYVVQKGGVVNAYDLAADNVELFLDLSARVDTRSEGGALGLAFHPKYPDSNYVYVNYTVGRTGSDGVLTTRISRFTVADRMATDPPTERILLTIAQPAGNHNGGDLAFGPDGYLYIPTGDGGGGGDPFDAAQDPGSYLGKILRIDVDRATDERNYGIPEDNPFFAAADTLAEIYALGLRNPWRISFDRGTGDLWIGDVGQGNREEIDVIRAEAGGGQNFGWSCREGGVNYPDPSFRCAGRGASDFVEPVVDYTHNLADRLNGVSVTGGFVYRGPDPELTGRYFFADFGRQRIFSMPADAAGPEDVTVYTDLAPASVSTFGEGTDGHLYVADYGGAVYRIRSAAAVSVPGLATRVGEMKLAPNPSRGAFRITLPAQYTGAAELQIHSLANGQVVRAGLLPVTGGQAEFAAAGLPSGLYSVTLQTDGLRYVSRLAIQ